MRKRFPFWYLLILPSFLFGFGFFLNALHIAANNGHMTVMGFLECVEHSAELHDDPLHTCMDKNTHLKVLGDWVMFPGMGIASIGDFLMWQWEYTFWPFLFAWICLMLDNYNRERY